MLITIDVTGDRACGKTAILRLIKKSLQTQRGLSMPQVDPIISDGEREFLTLEVVMDRYPLPEPTPEDFVHTLMSAAAKSSDERDGNEAMKYSQAALNMTNAMVNLRELNG